MDQIIPLKRSIIPSCDTDLLDYKHILESTGDLEKVGAYKIGFELALRYGLPRVVELAWQYTGKPLIYDHQKAGTDTPDTGGKFARIVRDAGFDAVILFPQAGPKTEEAWIKAAQDSGLGVIVGGEMTHEKYKRSEGGYIADNAVYEMYTNAASLGVRDFVVPGTKSDSIQKIKDVLLLEGVTDSTFYSPGFGSQGGNIEKIIKVLDGSPFHAIIGRGIYEASDMRQASLDLINKL